MGSTCIILDSVGKAERVSQSSSSLVLIHEQTQERKYYYNISIQTIKSILKNENVLPKKNIRDEKILLLEKERK